MDDNAAKSSPSTQKDDKNAGNRHVPGAKQPKARPQQSLREKLLPSAVHAKLPKYTGPFAVGTMEIEIPVEQPRSFAPEIKRHHRPVLELETLLMTVFYPADRASGQGLSPDGGKRWSRETWIPHPRLSVGPLDRILTYGPTDAWYRWLMATVSSEVSASLLSQSLQRRACLPNCLHGETRRLKNIGPQSYRHKLVSLASTNDSRMAWMMFVIMQTPILPSFQ